MLRALAALIAAIVIALPAAAARTAPPAGQDWYFIERNAVQGGYWQREMVDLAQRGVIRPATQVKEPGYDWRFARDVPALRGQFGDGPAPVTGPVTGPDTGIQSEPLADVQTSGRPMAGPAPSPDAVASDYLAGRWEAVLTNDMAGRAFEMTVRYDFRADGTYLGSTTTRMPDSPEVAPLVERTDGSWSLFARDAANFRVNFATNSGLYVEPLTLRTIDDRTMVTADGQLRFVRQP